LIHFYKRQVLLEKSRTPNICDIFLELRSDKFIY